MSATLAQLGGVLVDADVIAREVVKPGTTGLELLVEAFGNEILDDDGALDRPALAATAFGDDGSRAKLNSILHPLIGSRTAELIENAPSDAVVIQDIPLLVENKMGSYFQLVAVVYADAEERISRLVGQRKMSEEDARARIAAQASDDERRAAADVWLDNSGAPGDLDSVVRALWFDRLVPFEQNIRDNVSVAAPPMPVPADPEWSVQAQRLIGRIEAACGSVALRTDHIGSTAVPHLSAVDAIDVQITVAGLEAADAIEESLRLIGFPRVAHVTSDYPKPAYGVGGEADPAVWAKRLHRGADPGRPADVHIRVDGWPGQQFALVFRDWLRADPAAAAEYEGIKRSAAEIAERHDTLVEQSAVYDEAKAPWFDQAYVRAWNWASETGWSPA